jgi:23S rRNA (guanosine2251-2'-O)-methyltransferase
MQRQTTMAIIEGRNPVIEALRAGRPISRILMDRNAQLQGAAAQILKLARSSGVVVELVDKQVIDRQGVTGSSQGVIAFAASKDYVSLDALFRISRAKQEPALYPVLTVSRTRIPGAMRTAEVTGIHGV